MTRNANFKRRLRARIARTGESYTTALRHLQPPQATGGVSSLRLAVAQTSLCNDPTDRMALQAMGREIRALMDEARAAGARLVHFPEGATCAPNKRIVSSLPPGTNGRRDVGPADWARADWAGLAAEIEAIGRHAGAIGLWVVLGAIHPDPAHGWPFNSLHVFSDRGRPVARYDERMLSHTKASFLYRPGREPVVFDVDGMRFGCALGMEAHYPELFIDYETRQVDCVLFSTTGEPSPGAGAFAAEALGHAASNFFWVSYSAHAPQSLDVPAGIAGPDGSWAARCAADGRPGIAIAAVRAADPAHPARAWRRAARARLLGERVGAGD